MSATSFVRTLYSCFHFSMKSFMYAPTVYRGNSKTITVNHHPIILIQYDERYAMDKHPDPTFKVHPKTQLKVTKFFGEILSWFSIEDLFIIDETTGKLINNLDYRNLYATVKGSYTETQIMRANPGVVTIGSKEYPGVLLYINSTKNGIMLKEEDVEAIYGILSTFNFQQESLFLMYVGNHPELWREVSGDQFNSNNPFAKA